MQVHQRRVLGLGRGSRAEINIARTKVKVVRMLIVVFVTFSLSWLPLYVLRLHLLFSAGKTTIAERMTLKNYVLPVAQWLGAANSAVNPFVYCYFSASFRSAIRQLLRRAAETKDTQGGGGAG